MCEVRYSAALLVDVMMLRIPHRGVHEDYDQTVILRQGSEWYLIRVKIPHDEVHDSL